jgi:hypothetical protein
MAGQRRRMLSSIVGFNGVDFEVPSLIQDGLAFGVGTQRCFGSVDDAPGAGRNPLGHTSLDAPLAGVGLGKVVARPAQRRRVDALVGEQ